MISLYIYVKLAAIVVCRQEIPHTAVGSGSSSDFVEVRRTLTDKEMEVMRGWGVTWEKSLQLLKKGDLGSAKAYALEALADPDHVSNADWSLVAGLSCIGTGQFGEALSYLGKEPLDEFNPVGALARARCDVAVGLTDDARKIWDWYLTRDGVTASYQTELPPVDTVRGLTSRIMLVYGFHAREYPLLSLNAFTEAGRISPRSATIALSVVSVLNPLNRNAETLPFLGIAKVYGNEEQQKKADEALAKFSDADRTSALTQARSNPLKAYQP